MPAGSPPDGWAEIYGCSCNSSLRKDRMDTPAASRPFCLILWALLCLQGAALAGDDARTKVAFIDGPRISPVEVVGSRAHPIAISARACAWAASAGHAKVEPQVAKFPKVPARKVPRPYRANPKSSPRDGATMEDLAQLARLDEDDWKAIGAIVLIALVIVGGVWLFQAKKKRRQRAGA